MYANRAMRKLFLDLEFVPGFAAEGLRSGTMVHRRCDTAQIRSGVTQGGRRRPIPTNPT